MPISGLTVKKQPTYWRSQSIKKTPKKPKRKFLRVSFIIIIFFILFLGATIFAGLLWISKELPNPNKLSERNIAQSTKIYDRTGKVVLYEIFTNQRRTLVKLSDIPRDVSSATIMAEDKDFFNHSGFQLKSIARAVIINVLRGGKVQGGSTLTQQLVKNAFLSPEKTYIRKIKEIFLSYQIEQKYTKEEILQMYFNEIPYGSNAYGVEAASQIYFGKSVRDLTLDEAALLAALPKAPTYYSPDGNHREELIARKNYILDLMVEGGYISPESNQKAKNINTLEKIISRRENIIAPHFVMYIKELLTDKYGQRLVEEGGLKVITTLDADKQKIAEESIGKFAEKNEKTYGATNAALVSMDVKTGQILAMVGSKDFFNNAIDGQVNVALRSRQPGSSFKPIVYAEAFENGFTPETIVFDTETNFGSSGIGQKDYIPQNYNKKFNGPVTMRKALAGSLNIPGVKTLYLAGVDNVLDLASRMGYTTLTDRSRYGLSLVLGGGEVELLEHVSAFGIFAREGKKIPNIAILKVEDNEGKTLEINDSHLFLPQEVLSQQSADYINDILSDNKARSYVFGEQNYFTLPDRPVAAKSGTTNDFKDAWTIGYTPSLVTGVWVGNSRNTVMKEKADGGTIAAPIWQNFMKEALKNTPPENFIPPQPISTDKSILKGELPNEVTVKIDRASGKLATDLTPASFIIEKTFKGYHDILYYVDKNNPQGPALQNPADDPQYSRWEEGIQKWLTEEAKTQKNPSLIAELAPTTYDDLHIPANQPTVSIIWPNTGAISENKTLEVKLGASAPRGIKKIICSVDSIPVTTAYYYPYKCEVNLIGLNPGEHKISATAYDDIDNSKTEEIFITTTQFFEKKITWISPENNKILWQSNFPVTLSVLAPIVNINNIKFLAQNLETNQTFLISTIFTPETNGQFDLNWPSAQPGKYKLWVEAVDTSLNSIPADEINIEVK